jgi:transcriptional regulator with XRE-family HTH domain
MSQKNQLFQAPPYVVEEVLKHLGQNLRIARRRRRLSITQVAEKIGTGLRVVSDAERGKPSTAIAVYTALLWIYDFLGNMREIASPLADAEGLRLAALRETHGGRLPKSEPDNDF